MSQLSRSELLMMLLAAPGPSGKPAEPVQGTTRLQKLLFLLEHEAKLKPQGADFQFEPWKFGPVSKELYDDLEKLENLGFLESEPVSAPSTAELDEYGLSFDDLMGGEESQSSVETLEEKQYRLTTRGLDWITKQQRNDPPKAAAVEEVRRLKSKYAGLSLKDLLYYVYTKYPTMTTASEIRGQVIRRR